MSDEERQKLRNTDLADRLWRLREINRSHKEGRISVADRVRLHNELVPGIGDLGTGEGEDNPRERKRHR